MNIVSPTSRKPRKYKSLADVLANTITMPNGCMEWKGARDVNGYGRTHHNGRSGYKAHRLAMEYSGHNTNGWLVCHKCDNPPCINPDHLFLGTTADNAFDAQLKGRIKLGKPKPPPTGRNKVALHGTKAKYSNGCRCKACTQASTTYVREYRRRKAVVRPAKPAKEALHGTKKEYDRGCRCYKCKEANGLYFRLRRLRAKLAAWLDRRGLSLDDVLHD